MFWLAKIYFAPIYTTWYIDRQFLVHYGVVFVMFTILNEHVPVFPLKN